MKKEKLFEKIRFHQETKTYTKITRQVSKHKVEYSHGYILDHSDDFILLHETNEFDLVGYNVLPIEQISKLRFNKWDKYYDKIMRLESQTELLGVDYNICLDNWRSVFSSLQERGLNVIVECEEPDIDLFSIGPITKIKKKSVSIHNYDPAGFFDDKPRAIAYNLITKVQFDQRYCNIFSKYTRYKKRKISNIK